MVKALPEEEAIWEQVLREYLEVDPVTKAKIENRFYSTSKGRSTGRGRPRLAVPRKRKMPVEVRLINWGQRWKTFRDGGGLTDVLAAELFRNFRSDLQENTLLGRLDTIARLRGQI